ncbi:MAG TPA: HIT family protein [Planctomycetota bacterium]|nr:HIT family protein [Planctomycetota bacterium]
MSGGNVSTVACVQCEVTAGARTPPGGIVLETERFLVHGLLAPSPIAGWLVVAARRHVRWWWELSPEELSELGPLAARVMKAQRAALGAEHAYALALGDVLHHMHLHVIPRYASTPKRLWGRGAWDATPEEMLKDEDHANAARTLRDALASASSFL